MRTVRKALWVLPLMIGIFVVISEVFGWAYLRLPAERTMSSFLNRKVTLGKPFQLHLRRTINLDLQSLKIEQPDGLDGDPFINLDEVRANLHWGVIVGGRPHLALLSIGKGSVNAIRNEDGLGSWDFKFSGEEANRNTEPQAAELPRIDSLDVGEIELNLRDMPSDLVLQAVGRTQHADRETLIAVAGAGKLKDRSIDFDLEVVAPNLAVDSIPSETIEIRATSGSLQATFIGQVSNLASFDGMSGKLSVSGSSLSDIAFFPGVSVPRTPPFELSGTIERVGSTLKVLIERADIGSSQFAADMTYDSLTEPPILSGLVNARKLLLQDLGPAIGTQSRVRSATSSENAGRVLPVRKFDFPDMRAMDADISLEVLELDLGTPSLRSLHRLNTHLVLKGGLLKLEKLDADLAGGQVRGRISLDATDPKLAPTLDAELEWLNVDLGEWIKGESESSFIAGRFSGSTKVLTAGLSTAGMFESMDASVKGRVTGGAISHLIVEASGLDIAQTLGVLISENEPLAVSCALLDIVAKDGVLSPNVAVLNTKDSLLFLDGQVNLATEEVALRFVPSPKDWSILSLRTPILIRGTLGKLSFTPEAESLVLKDLSSVLLGAVTPIAALIPLMDFGSEQADRGCQEAVEAVKEHAQEVRRK